MQVHADLLSFPVHLYTEGHIYIASLYICIYICIYIMYVYIYYIYNDIIYIYILQEDVCVCVCSSVWLAGCLYVRTDVQTGMI